MKEPIVLKGQPFDWDRAEEVSEHVVSDDGEVNWGAAMMADPGVIECPKCKVNLWNVGTLVKCPECGNIWVNERG